MTPIPFQTINWNKVEKITHHGITGTASMQTWQLGVIKVRIVEYSANYLADHWCEKGHVVYCLEGEFTCELKGQESVQIKTGMSFVVSDDQSSHRSVSEHGAKLLIVDGDFLTN